MKRAPIKEHFQPLGPRSLAITVGDRQLRARHCDDVVLSRVDSARCDPSHAFAALCLSVDTTSPPTRALYVSLSAAAARFYAAGLLELAAGLDDEGALR